MQAIVHMQRLADLLLVKHGLTVLPIALQKLCSAEGVRLITYKEGAEAIKKLDLEKYTVGNPAFSMRRVIFFDDTRLKEQQRMDVAYMLGFELFGDYLTEHYPKRTRHELLTAFADELLMPTWEITPIMDPLDLGVAAKVTSADAERRLSAFLLSNKDEPYRSLSSAIVTPKNQPAEDAVSPKTRAAEDAVLSFLKTLSSYAEEIVNSFAENNQVEKVKRG